MGWPKFGKKSKNQEEAGSADRPSPSPANSSPYVQKNDYQQDAYIAKPSGGIGNMGAPPPYDGSNSQRLDGRLNGPNQQQRYEKSPVPTGGYGGGNVNERYGGNSGYGGGRYGGGGTYGDQNAYGLSNNPYGDATPRQPSRSGGYGGMGGVHGNEIRNVEPFGKTGQRPLEQNDNRIGESGKLDNSYTEPGATVEPRNNLYGGAQVLGQQNRNKYDFDSDEDDIGHGELTAEQQEDRDVRRIFKDTNKIRYESNQSLKRSNNILDSTLAGMEQTSERLRIQNEQIERTYKTMQMTGKQIERGDANVKTLQSINMLNKGNLSERQAKKKEQQILNDHYASSAVRERDNKEQFDYEQQDLQHQREVAELKRRAAANDREPPKSQGPNEFVVAEDKDGLGEENELHGHLGDMYHKMKLMHAGALNQNHLINHGARLAEKANAVTDENQIKLEMANARLNRAARK